MSTMLRFISVSPLTPEALDLPGGVKDDLIHIDQLLKLRAVVENDKRMCKYIHTQ